MQKHLVRPQFATGFQKAPFGRRTMRLCILFDRIGKELFTVYAYAVVELATENERRLLHLAPKQWCGALVCERDRFFDPPLSLLATFFLTKFSSPSPPTKIKELTAGSDEKTQRSPAGSRTKVLLVARSNN